MSRFDRRTVPLLASLVLLLVTPPAAAAQENSVEGAWRVTHWETADASYDAQPGLFIFTTTHYAMMFTQGADARGQYDSEAGQTDEETLAAYGSFIANAGRYSLEGDQLTTRAYVAKDPNYMAAFPDNQNTFTVHFAGDVLHITFVDFLGGDTRVTLQRVEGVSMETPEG
ncbi:MAG TPA: lipocalin-like domain-containing protein [Longimicrobiales bacterium]|nr:lipocalin-like domain-containing protein [Longimicrobiales bacterium]